MLCTVPTEQPSWAAMSRIVSGSVSVMAVFWSGHRLFIVNDPKTTAIGRNR